MAKTAAYVQKGEAIDYKNNTEVSIPANTVLVIGKRIGVSGTEIPAGQVGSVHMTGVFDIPKKTGVALAAGDDVTFTDDNGIDKATADSVGYAVADAAAGDETVRVKLMG